VNLLDFRKAGYLPGNVNLVSALVAADLEECSQSESERFRIDFSSVTQDYSLLLEFADPLEYR